MKTATTETELMPAGAMVRKDDSPEALAPIDLIQSIVRAARDPAVDVDKMERLCALHERITARQAEKEFNEALRVMQSKLPPVIKTSRNPSTNSDYAKLEHIQDVVNPVLFEHGFSLSFGTDKSELPEHYGVTALLSHSGGHSRPYRCDVPSDTHGPKGLQNKTKTHGFGSAMSYGERYLMKLIFNIRLIGEDDDGNRAGRAKPQGPGAPKPKLETATTDDVALKKKLVDLTRGVSMVTKGYALDERAKQAIFQWLIDENMIADTEGLEDLTGARLAEVVGKVEKKLRQ